METKLVLLIMLAINHILKGLDGWDEFQHSHYNLRLYSAMVLPIILISYRLCDILLRKAKTS